MFVHYANDTLLIGDVEEPLSEFLLDEPAYTLPAQALWRIYVPGEKHLLGYGWTQRNEAMPWDDGDAYLAREATYAASYALRHIDTSPDVAGFEAALVDVFGGDYLEVNSLYSGWPLFKNALELEQWTVADLLLSDSYVNYEIDTAAYTAIVTTARAYYIPMSLQGRPGIMPLRLIDDTPAVTISFGAAESGSLGLSDSANLIALTLKAATDSLASVLSDLAAAPTILIPATDDATVHATETAATAQTLLLHAENEVTAIGSDDPTPVIV